MLVSPAQGYRRGVDAMPNRVGVLAAVISTVCGAAEAAFPSCAFVNHAIDTGTDNLGYVRIAARADGRPVIVYTTDVHNASTLNLFDCDDATCASGQLIPLDASTNYFGSPGIVIRGDGRPAVTASWYGGVRYYDCQDTTCNVFTYNDIRPMRSGILSDMPIALQSNGNPAFLYIDANSMGSPRPGYLIAHFCTDTSCSSGTEQTLAVPAANDMLANLSIAIGADGIAAATYLESIGASNSYTYQIARCTDSACTSVTNEPVSALVGGTQPYRTIAAVRSNHLPVLLDSQATHLALLDCTTASCSAFNDQALPILGASQPVGLQLLADDVPAFALFGAGSAGAFACANADCTSGIAVAATTSTQSIFDADFALDATHRPLIAYIDFDTRKLSAAGCERIFADGFE
jgi:hypothetical protein